MTLDVFGSGRDEIGIGRMEGRALVSVLSRHFPGETVGKPGKPQSGL